MTDVTNASKTMLMNIHTQQWDPELCKYAEPLSLSPYPVGMNYTLVSFNRFFGIPMNILPEIRSCSEVYGHIVSPLSMTLC